MQSLAHHPTTLRALAAVVSLALVSVLVVRTSEAAFSDTSTNTGNSFAVATLTLTHAPDTVPMFDAGLDGVMVPGTSFTECVDVTAGGTWEDGTVGDVRVYGSGTWADSGSLAAALALDLTVGAAGETCGATAAGTTVGGFATMADLQSAGDYASGASLWTPSSSDPSRPVYVTVTLDPAADDLLQGATLGDVDVTFELRTP